MASTSSTPRLLTRPAPQAPSRRPAGRPPTGRAGCPAPPARPRRGFEAAGRARPDVIWMDVGMPVMDGIEATRRITQSTDVRSLILTTFDLDEYVFAALRAGASGFLLKDTLPADLLTAIRVVAAGEALLAPSITRRLISEFSRTQSPAPEQAASAAPVTARLASVDLARPL